MFSGTDGLITPIIFFFPLECKFLWSFSSFVVDGWIWSLGQSSRTWEVSGFIDGLEKIVCQKSYKEPWGMEGSLMTTQELEQFWCSFKVLWGTQWPWNSLEIRNYLYDQQVYFLPSPPVQIIVPRNVKNRFLYIEDDISIYSLWVKQNFQVLLVKIIQWILNLNIIFNIFTNSAQDSDLEHSLCF